jgi:hypothetical protein
VAAGQTLEAPVDSTFAWTGAWTVAAWLRAGAQPTSACHSFSLTDGTNEAGLSVQEFDRSVPRSYPPVAHFTTSEQNDAATSITFTVPADAAYGQGTYTVSVSGKNANYDTKGPKHIFSRITSTSVRTILGIVQYDQTPPYAAKSDAPDLLGNGITGERGQWLTVQAPRALYLHKVIIYIVSGSVNEAYPARAPGGYRIYGDNNDDAWVLLHEVTTVVYSDLEKCTSEAAGDAYAQPSPDAHIYTVATVNDNVAYTRFAIIFNNVNGNAGYIDIAGMEFQATEAPPVSPAWTHVALTHAAAAPTASLHVNGGAGTSVAFSGLATGGSVRITGAAVDDLRVYASDLSGDLERAGAPAAAASGP